MSQQACVRCGERGRVERLECPGIHDEWIGDAPCPSGSERCHTAAYCKRCDFQWSEACSHVA